MRNPIWRPLTFTCIPRRIPAHLCWTLSGLILFATLSLATPASATDTPPRPHHKAHRIRRTAAKRPAEAVPPPAPPLPNWPINAQPQPPTVTWDSHGLAIIASNSSLIQILQQVSTATGVSVVGLSGDKRIFGTYGPGPAREVLAQLLTGTGYNVLILGGTDSAPPTRIILSQRPTGPAPPPPPSQESNYDNGYPADATPQPPIDSNSPGFQPSPPVRTPQQIMEEMQRRRLMQLQQQQQQGNPNSPNN